MNHLWSLAIEEQFYLLWPLVVFAARTRLRVLWVALLLSVAALGFRFVLMAAWGNAYAAHHSMFARADALLLGGVLAMLYRGPAWPRVLAAAPWLCTACAGLVVVSLLLPGVPVFASMYWIFCVRFSIVAFASCGLLAWSLRPGVVSRAFSVRGLRWFGKYSYGLYVLHLIFLPYLSRAGREGFFVLTQNKAAAVALTAFAVLGITSLAAWLSFQFYEKPFLRLKRYFDYAPATRPVS